jgi:hypothetical protein
MGAGLDAPPASPDSAVGVGVDAIALHAATSLRNRWMGTIPKVISLNDSDLKEPIELVHRELEVKVGVVNPHRWDAGVGLCSRHSSGKFG